MHFQNRHSRSCKEIFHLNLFAGPIDTWNCWKMILWSAEGFDRTYGMVFCTADVWANSLGGAEKQLFQMFNWPVSKVNALLIGLTERCGLKNSKVVAVRRVLRKYPWKSTFSKSWHFENCNFGSPWVSALPYRAYVLYKVSKVDWWRSRLRSQIKESNLAHVGPRVFANARSRKNTQQLKCGIVSTS